MGICLNCGGKGYRIYRHKNAKRGDNQDPIDAQNTRWTRTKCKRCQGTGIITIYEKIAEIRERKEPI